MHQDNNQQDVKISYGAGGGYTTTDANGNTSTVLDRRQRPGLPDHRRAWAMSPITPTTSAAT